MGTTMLRPRQSPRRTRVAQMSILTRRWNHPVYELCSVCGHPTSFRTHENVPLCSACEDVQNGPAPDDHRLDSPVHGQARDINKERP